MKVASIGGIANDGVDYTLWLEQPFSQPSLRLERLERAGGDPLVTQTRLQALTLALKARIWGADEDETGPLREALLAALDTQTGAVALIICDDDDTNERYRYVVCMGVDEQPEGEGTGQYLVATLVTHGDARWRSTTETEETWAVTASGQTTVVANGGSLAARPVYTFQPTDQRTSGDYYEYRMFIPVTWPSWYARRRYPINLTNQEWDTETLATAGDIYAGYGEDNIGVVVNGKEVRRWITGYDTANTGVWVNLDFEPQVAMELAESIGSGDTVTTIRSKNSYPIGGMPQSGLLLINSEVFAYDGKDEFTNTFLNVRRAVYESTAGNHTGSESSTADTIYWLQHEVWVVYGGTAHRAQFFDDDNPLWTAEYDALKPMLNLADSWNDYWAIDEFGADGRENQERPVTWLAHDTPGNWTEKVDEPWDKIVLVRADPTSVVDEEGAPDRSWWSLSIAFPLTELYAEGTAARYQNERWDVRFDMGQSAFYQALVPAPAQFNTFETWTLTHTDDSPAGEELRFIQECGGAVEVLLDELTITYLTYPAVSMMTRQAIYSLAATLTNETSGEAITLRLEMELDDVLEVDTENYTVTLDSDGTNQYQALTRDTRRREILTLLPGNNTLRLDETGLQEMTVTVTFRGRTYT